ncbi:GNAT family N-acetyltransferase [Alkalibacillus haloalkaliphilus]|uniref:GNAT family N-acetyltransferase n=1 Tax=Alkalibacillus haloalkaliphilus TaxID=94136 RepID=UPI0029356F06|nr:GNAT family N-acetyltransferase [Alkalibacillus haloalkaliphilus]MDV2581353.1 GNAT family N-acetyltransferase [Alkalibacillus haloalkaliphilus]
MHIREIENRDNKAMEYIIKQSLEEFNLDIPGTAYYDPELSNLTEHYAKQQNAQYWVVVNDENDVLGGAGIGPFQDNIGELQKLYIKRDAQGLGLSKKLMKVALEFAKQHYTHCYLETMEILHAANQLYSNFGFEQLQQPLDGSDHGTMDTWFIKEL